MSDNQIKIHIKYKDSIKKAQRRWAATERGREMTRIRNAKYYYRKKNLYHPEYNVDGEIEGKKYKRNS